MLTLLAVVGLFGCEPNARLTGVAAGAAGRYVVTAYIVAGDTLFALLPGSMGYTPGINKVGVENFTVELAIVASDRLSMQTTYRRNGRFTTVSKEVTVRLTNYSYAFSPVPPFSAVDYEGNVGRFTGVFYERTVGGGPSIPLAGAPATTAASSGDVVIVAQPTR